MTSIVIFALVALSSILLVALALSRTSSMRPQLRNAARFIGGPFSISIAIHLAILFTLIVAVHESRARDLLIVTMTPGTDRAIEQAEQFELPYDGIPDFKTHSADDSPPEPIDVEKVMRTSSSISGTPADTGLEIGRRLGAFNIHPGYGGGGDASFPGFVGELRRKGLDIVIVIDGTKSMDFVMADVKARMTRLAVKIRELVPIARVGAVVYGGKGEPLDIQPLTISTAKLQSFLGSIQAKGGGEWEENTYGAVQTAITKMQWKPYARKVIVLIGDSPPEKEDFAPMVALLHDFRQNHGTLSAVDVTEEEHERFEREFAIKVHRDPEKTISPLPQFARQAQIAYKVLATEGGGSVRSLTHEANIDQQVMILVFGDRWQEEVRRYASR
jgi:hypothetical protein